MQTLQKYRIEKLYCTLYAKLIFKIAQARKSTVESTLNFNWENVLQDMMGTPDNVSF